MKLYDVEDPFKSPLNVFFPFDSVLPIPLEFFLTSSTVDEVFLKLKGWPQWNKVLKALEIKVEHSKTSKD